MAKRADIDEIVRRFTDATKKEGISIDKVVLYGSYASGHYRDDSDIDVAIVSRDFGRDRTEEGMMLFRIAGKIDARIEPVPISLKAYENDTWVPLIYEIRENGVELKAA